jgi:antitoxin component YwqK of YwqJK toxin-antitoxin module
MFTPSRFVLFSLPLAAALLLTCCEKKADRPRVRSGPELEVKADGLHYQPGDAAPFTGAVRHYQPGTGRLLREANYTDGKLDGHSRRWFKENPDQISHDQLWVRGDPVFEWRWWPNGQLKELSSQRNGTKEHGRPDIAYGAYVKWFQDGTLQFKAYYDETFQWHGHIIDYNDAGELQWDAEFRHGVYLKGHRPPNWPAPAAAPAPVKTE